MNIHDVPAFTYPETCWLAAIFARQEELRVKYHDVESRNGLLQTAAHPLVLDDRHSQARIKDFAWRVTEELAEAVECLEQYYDDPTWPTKPEVTHFQEELMDALHFLTELTILVGMSPADVTPSMIPPGPTHALDCLLGPIEPAAMYSVHDVQAAAFRAITALGMACNCLKNKPWKVTHQLTDAARFRGLIRETWIRFFALLATAGYDAKGVYDMYIRKSEVNKFRQRSKY